MLFFGCIASLGADNTYRAGYLTEAEAKAIVEGREAAEEARYQAFKEKMASAEVVESKTVQTQGGSLKFNQVRPLVLEKVVKPTREEPKNTMTPEEWAAYMVSQQVRIPEQISLGANVYGDSHSEITWRDTETGARFTVWTNVSLNYLRPVSSIQAKNYDYMYFGFVTPYTKEDEQRHIQIAREHGVEVESRWKEPPVAFTGGSYEYIVITEDTAKVPDKLYRQLDALIGHYVAHREELEIEYENSQTLEAARQQYLKENPPQPRETLVNFWKIEDEAPAR